MRFRAFTRVITAHRSEHMNKLLKSVLLFIFIGLFCGCIGGNDLTNSEEDTRPDIFVKKCYKDYCDVIKGEDSGLSMYDNSLENYTYLPYFVCENGEDYYYVINNSIYKYSNNTSELLFSVEENIFALVGVYEEDIYYTSQNSLWKYDTQKDVSKKGLNENLSHFDTVMVENYLIVKDSKLYIYDIVNNQKIEIEDYLEKDQEEINQMLPDGFSIRRAQGGNSLGNNMEMYYDNGKDLVKIGFARSNINENNKEEMLNFNDRMLNKINIIDDDLYVFYVCSKTDERPGPIAFYGTAERCRTKYWELDRIKKVEGPDLYGSSKKEETFYEDSTNRIIGYNPYTSEVYLYVFENGTLTAKDLDDQSEKVIETLKEADTIQFEWHDTRLYWKYIKNGNEEFGGCHEFN